MSDFGADRALAASPSSRQGVSPLPGFDHGYGDIASALHWIAEQARNGMATACGCASTHGDSGGGLEMLNSILSDIEINATMALDALAATQSTGEAA